jgi:hypothetical protein
MTDETTPAVDPVAANVSTAREMIDTLKHDAEAVAHWLAAQLEKTEAEARHLLGL